MRVIVIKTSTVVGKKDVAYGLEIPSDVNPVVSDIMLALQQEICFIEDTGDVVTIKHPKSGETVFSVKNWMSVKTGEFLKRKAMKYNTAHVLRLFIETKEDRKDWSSNVAHWISLSKKRIVNFSELAPEIKNFKFKQEQGWTNTPTIIKCANCGSDIAGTRSVKGTQSVFTPDKEGVIKGEGKNCRKWYCGCTTKPIVIPEHLIKEVEGSVKDELEKLRLDYSIALADIKKLENMVCELTDKVNLHESNEGLMFLLRKVFVDNLLGSMDFDQILAFARVINYLKGEKQC